MKIEVLLPFFLLVAGLIGAESSADRLVISMEHIITKTNIYNDVLFLFLYWNYHLLEVQKISPQLQLFYFQKHTVFIVKINI